jgi:SpoIIAA-like
MGAEMVEVLGDLVTCKVSGKLTSAELRAVQQSAAPIIQSRGKVRLLVLVEDFQGWERSSEWADFSFQQENDAHIERMALVGEEKWEELAEAFVGKGLRDFPIEYFGPGEASRALRWLAGK